MSTNRAWLDLLLDISSNGHRVGPRGLDTLELLGRKTVISMTSPIITVKERCLGYRFMPAEAAWILSGSNQVEEIRPYSTFIHKFSDEGAFFFGAYGPRIIDQLPHVLKSLRADQATRQAVISIWRESPPPSKDTPCTLTLQWVIRDDCLHCFANMRSSDAWLGVPYDWFNFSLVSAYVLLWLRKLDPSFRAIELGNLHFYAASQHLYGTNKAAVLDIIMPSDTPTFDVEPLQLGEFPTPLSLINHLWALARRGGAQFNFGEELLGVYDE